MKTLKFIQMKKRYNLFIFAVALCLITACKSDVEKVSNKVETSLEETEVNNTIKTYPNNEVFWGNTHLHTSNSTDGFGAGTRLTTEDALRIASGESVQSNTGQPAKMDRPLDFIAITDHAEGFSYFMGLSSGDEKLLTDDKAKEWYDLLQKSEQGDKSASTQLQNDIPYALANDLLPASATDPEIIVPLIKGSWMKTNAVVEKYNKPGTFTALHAYEWTSVTKGNNLHRNLIFRDSNAKVDSIFPFSALQSDDPEKLWEFMDNYEKKTGGQVLAIPHNGNLSGGEMFGERKNGEPYDLDYVTQRNKWEPLYEVMQIKGAGETHPQLSPTDEFASFGIAGWDNGNLSLDILTTPEIRKTQYARKALIDGLSYEKELGVNPFKFGLVSATDSHTAITTMDEDNWMGKHTTSEPSPERLNAVAKEFNGVTRYDWQYLSGGYSAVWAKSNTREAIWDAMKRKETYATTGTRIKLRFFGSMNYGEVSLDDESYLDEAYQKGVPMGGDLKGEGTPEFIVHAIKDPNWANLDRIQIIKGWVDKDGNNQEKIYDVVWSGDRAVDANGKLPAVGNTVDLEKATYTNNIGANELKIVWKDPDFDPSIRAVYYARVLEIPSPTWRLYDIVKYNIKEIPEGAPLFAQERAWSSPIWYTPY